MNVKQQRNFTCTTIKGMRGCCLMSRASEEIGGYFVLIATIRSIITGCHLRIKLACSDLQQ